MTRDQLIDGPISTTDEFEAVLTEAVEKAVDAGVEVRGPWEFETAGSRHDWEVEIVELARDAEDGQED